MKHAQEVTPMRPALFVFLASTVLAACSGSVNDPNPNPNPNGNDSGTTTNGNDASPSSGPSVANVSLQSQCPGITPCGGAVEGTWDYTGGCAEVDFSSLQQACAGLTITNTSATVQARVVFAGGQVERSYTATGKATINVPAACAQPVGGCAVLQSEIQSGGNTATCKDDGSGGCSCDVNSTTSDVGSTTYTVQGDTVVTGDGNRYDFCVQGGTMTYTHSQGSSPEHGSFSLTKR